MTSQLLLLLLSCGSERQAAKVELGPHDISDEGTVHVATVEQLAAAPVPFEKWDNNLPRQPIEYVVYQVSAYLVGYKLEADLDWHLVLRGDSGQTMIAEMPDPACAPSPDIAQKFAQARTNLMKYIKAPRPGKLQRLNQPLRLTFVGVLFFDKCVPGHFPTGHAPNCAEIHPVDVEPGTDGGP